MNKLGTAIPKCFFCGKDKNVILINKRLAANSAQQVNDMNGQIIDKEPCEKCKGYMKMGIILIGVDEKKSTDVQNPYRTGQFVVVKDEVINDIVESIQLKNEIIDARMAFVPSEVLKMLGIFEK